MTFPPSAIERTRLAWWRTELSTLAVAALLLKLGISRHNWLEVTAAACAFATAVILYGLERVGRTRLDIERRARAVRIAAAATTITVVVAAAGVIR